MPLAGAQTDPIRNGLVLEYHLEGGSLLQSNGIVADDSGYYYNGQTIASKISVVPNCPKGSCFKFNGTDSFVDIRYTLASLLEFSGSGTISAWVKLNASGLNRPQTIFQRGTDGATGGWGFGLKYNGTRFYSSAVYTQAATQQINAFGTDVLIYNQEQPWYYLTAVWRDGASLDLYVNGNLQSRVNTSSMSLRISRENSTIGYNKNAGPAEFFAGQLDELRVWNRALSDQEINRLYTMGAFGNKYEGTNFVIPWFNLGADVSFIARQSARIYSVGLLVNKYGDASQSYLVSIKADLSGAPDATLASQAVVFAENPGKFWKMAAFPAASQPNLVAGTRYHIILGAQGGASDEERVSIAYIKSGVPGSQLASGRWQSDLSQGGLRVYTSLDGTNFGPEFGEPAFALYYSDGSGNYNGQGDGNPYDTVTSGRIFGSKWVSENFSVAVPSLVLNLTVVVKKFGSGTPADSLYAQVFYLNGTPLTSRFVLLQNSTASNSYSYVTADLGVGLPKAYTNLPAGNYRLALSSPGSDSTTFYRWLALQTLLGSPLDNRTFGGTASQAASSSDSGSSWSGQPGIDHSFYFDFTPGNCADGTVYQVCSVTKPKYCGDSSVLVDNASFCGCPTGNWVFGNSCVPFSENFTVAYFASSSPTSLSYRRGGYSGLTGPSTLLFTPGAHGNVSGIEVMKSSPVRREYVAATQDLEGNLSVKVWDGTSGGNYFLVTGVASVNSTRSFDVAYEELSGDAVVAYRKSSSPNNLFYRVWNGTIWSSELAVVRASGLSWVKLIARPNSDKIMALTVEGTTSLYTTEWSGSSFGSSSLSSTTLGSGYENFGFAYETVSGKGVLVYRDSAASNALTYRPYSAAGVWGSAVTISSVFSFAADLPQWMRLASSPVSNEITVASTVSSSGVPDYAITLTWSGTAFGSATSYVGFSPAVPKTTRFFDIAYMANGSLMKVFGNEYWTGGAQGSLPGISPGVSWVQLTSNSSRNELLAAVSDNATNVSIIKWDGSQWSYPQVVTNLSNSTYGPFSIAVLRNETTWCFDGTPYLACSATKPKYCQNLGTAAVDRADLCGCPLGKELFGTTCVENSTMIATYFDGAADKQKTQYRVYNPTAGFSSEGDTAIAVGDARPVINTTMLHILRASPVKKEMILVTQDTDWKVIGQVWDGVAGTWGHRQELGGFGQVAVAYEQNSGHAMVATTYFVVDPSCTMGPCGGTIYVQYSVWDGGSWSPLVTMPGAINPTRMRLVQVPNSNNLTLVVNAYGAISTDVWNGSAWDPSPRAAGTATCIYDCFDFAYRRATGEGVLAYSSSNSVKFKVLSTAGAWGSERTFLTFASAATYGAWVRLAASPVDDHVMLAVIDNASDLTARVWNGTSVVNDTQAQLNWSISMTPSTAFDFRPFDVAYMPNGTAVIAYGVSGQNATRYRTFTPNATGTGWSAESIGADVGGFVKTVAFTANPSANEVFALVVESTNNDLYALKFDGANLSELSKLETESYSGTYDAKVGFAMCYRQDLCVDGTPIGSCSKTKPLYCNSNKQLSADVVSCPCAPGQVTYPQNGFRPGLCVSTDSNALLTYAYSRVISSPFFLSLSPSSGLSSEGWTGSNTANTTFGQVLRAAPTRNETILLAMSAGYLVAQVWNGTGWGDSLSPLSAAPFVSASSLYYRSFDAAYENLAGDAVFAYRTTSSQAIVYYQLWNGNSWGSQSSVSVGGAGSIEQIKLVSKPASDEIMMLVRRSDGTVYASVWSGSSWGASANVASIAGCPGIDNAECFDFAYEQSTGRGLLVYQPTLTATAPFAKTFVGGAWTNATVQDVGGASAWIKLASKPNNDNIFLLTLDTNSDLNAQLWTGSSFSPSTSSRLELETDVSSYTTRAFDAVYQSNGNLRVVYGQKGVNAPREYAYTNVWSAKGTTLPNVGGEPAWVALSANPQSPGLYALVEENKTNSLHLLKHDGSVWSHLYQVDSNACTPYQQFGQYIAYTPYEGFAVAHRRDCNGVACPAQALPSSADVVATYYDSTNVSNVAFRYLNLSSSGWNAQSNAYALSGFSRYPRVLRSSPTRNEMLMVTGDDSPGLLAQVWKGSTTSWNSPMPLPINGLSFDNRPYDVAYEESSGDAMAVYAKEFPSSSSNLYYRKWNGGSWGLEGSLVLGIPACILSHLKLTPKRGGNQVMVLFMCGSTLYATVWNGGAFTPVVALSTDAAASTEFEFDFAFESLSGDGLAVFREFPSLSPKYKKFSFSGTSWDATATSTGSVGHDQVWIKLASNPLSDEIMIAALDAGNDLSVQPWTGSALGTLTTLETNVEYIPTGSVPGTRAFDMDYQANGTLVIAYGEASSSLPRYRLYTSSTWSAEQSMPSIGAPTSWVYLAANTTGSEVYALTVDNVSRNLTAFRWDGVSWSTPTLLSNSTTDTYGRAVLAVRRK